MSEILGLVINFVFRPVLFLFFPHRYYLNTIMEAENGTKYQAMVRKNYSSLYFQQRIFSLNEKEKIQ